MLQAENDDLRLRLQRSAENVQASNMAIHLLTVSAEVQRVRSDSAVCEWRAALAIVVTDRDALRVENKALHDRA